MKMRTWMLAAWTQAGVVVCGLGLGLAPAGAQQTAAGGSGWSVTKGEHGLEIRCGDRLVTTYRTADGKKPHFYPVIGPSGETYTRGYPMDPQPDEPKDHPHQRSLYFGHRNVNNVDFWSAELHTDKPNKSGLRPGTVRQLAMSGVETSADGVTLRVTNEWVDDQQQKKMADDTRVYKISKLANGDIALDWDLTLRANEDLTFGDDKDGTMAARFIPGLQLKAAKESNRPATGHILNSEGVRDADAWGKRAKWVDYSGVDRKGNVIGVSIFDHPENLRHPTWWHARDYGLCAANPFGIHHFEKKEEGAGKWTLKKGESQRFRYRFLLRAGEREAKLLEEAWQGWAKAS